MNSRLYVVLYNNENARLVEATTPAQAIRYCATARYTATPAKPREVAILMGRGVKVEQAGVKPAVQDGALSNEEQNSRARDSLMGRQ